MPGLQLQPALAADHHLAAAAAVFHIGRFAGEPIETDEMRPEWFEHGAIPYSRMWADDVHWYPLFLRGSRFEGIFAFERTHELVWQQLSELPAGAAGGGGSDGSGGFSGSVRCWLDRLPQQ